MSVSPAALTGLLPCPEGGPADSKKKGCASKIFIDKRWASLRIRQDYVHLFIPWEDEGLARRRSGFANQDSAFLILFCVSFRSMVMVSGIDFASDAFPRRRAGARLFSQGHRGRPS